MPTSPLPNWRFRSPPPAAAVAVVVVRAAVAAAGGEEGGRRGRAAGQRHELAARDRVLRDAGDRARRLCFSRSVLSGMSSPPRSRVCVLPALYASGRRQAGSARRDRAWRQASRRGCAPARGRCGRRPRRIRSGGTRAKERRRLFSPPSIMKSGPATKATPSALASASRATRVGALGEVEPEEVAAAGDDELGLGDLLAQRRRPARRGAPCSAPLTNSMLRSSPPERQSSRTIDLGQHVRRDVGLVGALGQLRDLLRRARPGSRPGRRG